VFEGEGLRIDGEGVSGSTGVVVRCDRDVDLEAVGEVEVLLLQGRPIGEPQAHYGPFVMNTEAELEAAFADYRRTQFGGWPWPQPGPVHGREPRRFARRPDGSADEPVSV
jgi:redox-sensitive bicupin YhaK (pirin superfamily)